MIKKSTTLQNLQANGIIEKLPRQCDGIVSVRNPHGNNINEIILKDIKIVQGNKLKLVSRNKAGDEKFCHISFKDSKSIQFIADEIKKLREKTIEQVYKTEIRINEE